MRRRLHEDAGVAQMPQRQAERDMALFLVDWHDAHLRERGRQANRAKREKTGGKGASCA